MTQISRYEAMRQQGYFDTKSTPFQQEWYNWLNALKIVDEGWEKWYDERPEQTCKEMLPLIKERVKALTTMSAFPKEHPDTTLRNVANELGVTAVHCWGNDLVSDDEMTLTENVHAAYMEAQEPRTVSTLQAFAEKRDRQFNEHYYGKSTPGFGGNG